LVPLDLLRFIPGNKATFMVTLLIVAAINVYGRFEAENVGIRRVELSTTKLPPQVNNLRIAQISDIHFSTLNGLKLARKIEGIINDVQPDILVCTGDLIDRGLRDKKSVASVLNGIKTKYGKYAVTGNHEFISGIKKAVEFTEKAGFRLLRNEGIKIGGFIELAGIDDPAARRFGNPSPASEHKLLQSFSSENLNIFLKHQPRIEANSIGEFDLQLSGHTHGGQIYPFTLLSSLFYPYQNGLFELGKGSCLYVSRGTGTWGPPIRFLSFPEITVIEFRKK
jgi:predicted MPP superfamily phosphohydrolase